MGQKHGIQDRPPPMNVDEFLVWAEGREGKFELDDGTVVAMAPERLVHGRMKVSIQTALANAIRAAGLACESILDSIAVRITPTTSYVPDVLVHCGERLAGDVRETASPVVVVVGTLCSANRGSRRRSSPLRAPGIEPKRSSPSDRSTSSPLTRGDPSARTVASTFTSCASRTPRTRPAKSGSVRTNSPQDVTTPTMHLTPDTGRR